MVEVLWNEGQHFGTVGKKLDKFSTFGGGGEFLAFLRRSSERPLDALRQLSEGRRQSLLCAVCLYCHSDQTKCVWMGAREYLSFAHVAPQGPHEGIACFLCDFDANGGEKLIDVHWRALP